MTGQVREESMNCPFCSIVADEPHLHIDSNIHAVAFYDNFPVSPGHTLIVPKRHVADLFDAEPEEILDIFALLKQCREILMERNSPDGFNVGVNIGRTAGQTVFHLHVHLIPRYSGDVHRPTGGVRHIIPGKGFY